MTAIDDSRRGLKRLYTVHVYLIVTVIISLCLTFICILRIIIFGSRNPLRLHEVVLVYHKPTRALKCKPWVNNLCYWFDRLV